MLIIGLALAAVAIAFVASAGGDPERAVRATATPPPPPTRAPAGALELTLAYSPEKETLLAPLIKRFNAEQHKSGDRTVFIDATIVASGDAETRIAQGKLRPVLWSPASSFWGRLLNYEADSRLVADENPSIVRTPLVIAMWKQLAGAYGYPKRKLGYEQLSELATGGWAAVGKPQFGSFKYVHTNPDFSTSGISAVAASYYAAVGKKEGLTEADVTRGRPQVHKLERSIVHYGDTTLFIADEMRRRGLGYASAGAMEETTMIDFNRRAGKGQRLVAVYPEEGTFFSDNPLMTLQGDWVTPEQARAGKVFGAFLATAITPEVAGAQGFRPPDPDVKPAGLVTKANGVDPQQPARVLRLPEPKVLAKIKAAWRADRKPANVMMVFDNSGSMGEEDKLEQAKQGLKGFFRQAAPQDRIGLIKFSQDIVPLVGIAPMKTNRAKLLAATDTILPEDDTRVRDATLDGINAVTAHLDRDAINAVVLLTDGEDTSSNHTASDVVQALDRQREKETGQIRVFTIAYGSDPNAEELERYAQAGGGKSYKGGADDIGSIYRSISSFF
jgi:Ca-activated chloride channel family protein